MPDFKNITYLREGNSRQVTAWKVLNTLDIFNKLATYQPILTGTIPIEIDLPESDLDIICYCPNHENFARSLIQYFSHITDFKLKTVHIREQLCTIATFSSGGFQIEIFGQDTPTTKQYAYRHMCIEHQILMKKGVNFKKEIIKLKKSGLKTEPAFAKLLGLEGDPYEALLSLER